MPIGSFKTFYSHKNTNLVKPTKMYRLILEKNGLVSTLKSKEDFEQTAINYFRKVQMLLTKHCTKTFTKFLPDFTAGDVKSFRFNRAVYKDFKHSKHNNFMDYLQEKLGFTLSYDIESQRLNAIRRLR